MKIYFNRKPVFGPWGGGSKILSSIVEECKRRNHNVFFEEDIKIHKGFDVLFCFDPRPTQQVKLENLVSYRFKNPSSKLIQRVGDLGTHGKPELFQLIKQSVNYADLVIFPSNWAKETSKILKNSLVIPNAPLENFFVEKKFRNDNVISIVSHHWSNNTYKGFEIYELLDRFCVDNPTFKFTFIGRKPDNTKLKNYLEPQDIEGLVNNLPNHDLYITASKLEAGANHVLEAMAVGLPVLYHVDGGSINEYCENRGVQYSNFEELTNILLEKKYEPAIKNFSKLTRNSKHAAIEYVDVIERIYENKC